MDKRIYERGKLYEEVWKEPMTSLAKKYGVSDVALRKQCIKMDIPLPKAGHWTKVKSGHEVKIPPLPKSNVPERVEVTVLSDESSKLGRKMEDCLLFLPVDQRQSIFQYCSLLTVPEKIKKPHELIVNTKQYFQSKDEKKKPSVNMVINLNVSNDQRERVYRLYNTLFSAFERLGYTIETKKSQYRTYSGRVSDYELHICLKEDSVPVFIKEKQKRIEHIPTKEELQSRYSFIPSYDLVRTGELHFGIDSYHAKRKNWQDSDTNRIEEQIGEIIIWVLEAIQVEKTNREKRAAEKVRWLEEQRIRQEIEERKEKELKQIELLNQLATDWNKADRIRKFVDATEIKLKEFDEEEINAKLMIWLKWARDKADWMDPLVEKEDDFLGKSISLFSQFNRTE
ncbi:hypothetical protein [Bacillus canaveralius]|uniref:hypothetical protein n=1 Tax=Bacillus canaveralius TaxID=1403243 RepID=UPI000F7A8D5C|nr:hypothetical protein [Bacillus canaveralius]RSK44988.1 hypothetical protein EJA13_20240 [Bacillus canaveralius]